MPRLRSGCRAKLAPKAGIETGAEAGQPRVVLGKVGGVTAEQGGEEARDETQGEVMPETGAGAGAGQMMVWKGPKEGARGDDAAEESGAEEGVCELEEAEESSTEGEGTGAGPEGGAGQLRAAQQTGVGNDSTVLREEAEDAGQLEIEGWELWKEGRAERFRARGHSGHWYLGDPKWLQEDNAAWAKIWEQRLSARREKQVLQGDEAAAVATAAKAEGSRGSQRKRERSDGGRQQKKQKATQQKKRKVKPQMGVQSDRERGGAVTEVNRATGQGGKEISDQ